VLYLGIGAGRLAAPLHRAGIELVGVDAHPGMLAHVRRRVPGIEVHQALIEDLRWKRRFDLVVGPSSILAEDANLEVAARHLRVGGRVGMELMNPHWLAGREHDGVRLLGAGSGMEVDYRLPDGSVVTQVVDGVEHSAPPPEEVEARLEWFGLRLEWMGGVPDHDLSESPVYFVLAFKRRPRRRLHTS